MSKTDDEVSLVVEHFRPKPIFTVNRRCELESSVHAQKRRRARQSGFSSVYYYPQLASLRLVYLMELNNGASFVLHWNVSTVDPYALSFDSCRPASPAVQAQTEQLCEKLNTDNRGTSLLAVASKLLRSLNEASVSDSLVVAQGDQWWQRHHGVLLQTILRSPPNIPRNHQRIVDLAVLLLRCAAMSPKRDALCCPVPSVSAATSYDESMAMVQRILHLPDPITSHQSAQTSSPWLALFSSLPWMTQGTLTTKKPTSGSSNGEYAPRGTLSYSLTLELNPAEGSDTPRFNSLADRHQTAYHGTQIQHVWSILHFGLQPVRSENSRLKQSNGAALGEGVYVSPSFQFAKGYAYRTPPNHYTYAKALQVALKHPALLRLLGIHNKSNMVLQNYKIQCFPIFEVTVVAPPKRDEMATTPTVTRQDSDAAQYVVPNCHDVRLDKLHLTFELEPQLQSSRPSWLVPLLILLAAILWRILQ